MIKTIEIRIFKKKNSRKKISYHIHDACYEIFEKDMIKNIKWPFFKEVTRCRNLTCEVPMQFGHDLDP